MDAVFRVVVIVLMTYMCFALNEIRRTTGFSLMMLAKHENYLTSIVENSKPKTKTLNDVLNGQQIQRVEIINSVPLEVKINQEHVFTPKALKVEVVNDGGMNGKSIPIKIDR